MIACQANRLATTGGEALAAEHGTILTGLEGNLGGLAAFGAHSVEHLAGSAGSGTGSLTGHTAVTAAGGLILEALLGVERLFTGREDELIAAVFAYQRLVFVHGLEPPEIILKEAVSPADLVFDPTLAIWEVALRHRALTHSSRGLDEVQPRMVLPLNRTMLTGALAGLRGPLCLRLASACNHRPEESNRAHYSPIFK